MDDFLGLLILLFFLGPRVFKWLRDAMAESRPEAEEAERPRRRQADPWEGTGPPVAFPTPPKPPVPQRRTVPLPTVRADQEDWTTEGPDQRLKEARRGTRVGIDVAQEVADITGRGAHLRQFRPYLGTELETAPPVQVAGEERIAAGELLGSRAEVRRAIILSDVLGPPLSRRPRGRGARKA